MAKNEFYRNFSNRTSFNGTPYSSSEELIPAVLTKELITTLKPMGLNFEYAETWTFPHGKKVPVIFIPHKKGMIESYMKFFNKEVESYLKHNEDKLSGDLSLEAFMEDIYDEDSNGFDPTGTTENEDIAMFWMTMEMLIDDLTKLDKNMGKIMRLIIDGYAKKEILEKVHLEKGKTQGYAFIEKTQQLAKELYYKNYR